MAGRRTPPRDARAPGDAPQLGRLVHRKIAQEVRRRLAKSPGGHLVDGRLGELEVKLQVDLDDPATGEVALAAAIEEAIARHVDDAVEAAAAFRPGQAFCHRCESADCEHASPPGPREVFAGYTPTGVPRWTDLGQLCLDLRHPEIERFYDEKRRAILTQQLSGHELKADLLPEFHRSARLHDVLGQVCAGLFPLPGLAETTRGVALTFQAVATRARRGGRRVGLNLIGGGPGGEEAVAEAPPECKPWRSALLWAQARLSDLSRRRGKPQPGELERRVDSVLQGLARRIERELRGRGRRTRHAEERHRSGERPTRKAVDDLRGAGADSILVDPRHGTLVVLGERGRTHFFAPEGRLVSSVHYAKDAIGKRTRTGQWQPATADQIARLRAAVEESTG